MSLPRPRTVQFQISVRARIPRSVAAKLTNDAIGKIIEEWLSTGNTPMGFTIRVVIWDSSKRREIQEIDSSERGETLRATLRRALQERRLIIKKMGNTRK